MLFPLLLAAILTISFNTSTGGVAAKNAVSLYVLNSLPTRRERYSGFFSSCLLTSVHRTSIGFFRVLPQHSDMGTLVRTKGDEVSVLGRNTQGVRLIKLREQEKLNSVSRIEEREDDSQDGGEEDSAAATTDE